MVGELKVEYPAHAPFRSVGRVAISGLLLRLRTPMATVEDFRSQMDAALTSVFGLAAQSPDETERPVNATVSVHAQWTDAEVVVTVVGPAGSERLTCPRTPR